MISPVMFVVLFFVALFGGLVVLLLIALLMGSGPKKEYGVKSVTGRGEEVKSRAEKRIADYFARNGINYIYEKEAKTKGWLFDSTIGHPDFYLPDYDVYVEYWGLLDADDRSVRANYERNMKRKMAIYYKNNIKFVSLYPRNLKNLDWVFRKKFEKITGFELT